MKIFLFVLVATIFESVGDAVLRIALRTPALPARIGLFAVGGMLLTLYGTSLNMAPVEFARVVGIYIATLFVVFQLTNLFFFHVTPAPGTWVGGVLILAGSMVVALWK